MPEVKYQGVQYTSNQEETVLDTLLNAGLDVAHSCKAGLCQACMMLSEAGDVPERANKSLSEAQKAMGYFLACQCVPDESMSVADVNQALVRSEAKILNLSDLSASVTRLTLEAPIEFRAGQYVTVWLDENTGRSYSIASGSTSKQLEFHVKKIPGGAFSNWISEDAKVGHSISIQGPMGLCFYNAKPEDKLVLACVGTGLAPMMGVLRDALEAGHSGQIELLFGARSEEGFYAVDQLKSLAEDYPNVSVSFLAQETDPDSPFVQGDIYEFAANEIGPLKDAKVFVCGGESFVKKMKRTVFMAGANMQDISSDVFLPSAN